MGKDIWLMLQQVASCAEGVFCSGAITENQSERKALNQIIANNSAMFDVVRKGRTVIYRLTGLFFNKYRLPLPRSLFRQLNPQEILKLSVWSAYIVENNIQKNVPEDAFHFKDEIMFLDNFEEIKAGRYNAVITSVDRYGYFAAQGLPVVIPKQCQNKWVKSLLYSIFMEIDKNYNDNEKDLIIYHEGNAVTIPANYLVKSGIWPSSIQECHADKREYEKLGYLTGSEKWQRDQLVLPLWLKNRKNFQDHKFGVYPL